MDRQTTMILQDRLKDGGPNIKVTLSFAEFLSKHPKPVYSITVFVSTANFRFLQPVWAHQFMTTPIPIFFHQLLISMNLFHHANSQAFSSFHSRHIIYLRILQSDWPRAF